MKAKLAIFTLFFAFFVPATTAVITPSPAVAACQESLFMIPAWYAGLVDGGCNITEIGQETDSLKNFVVKVALNIIRAGFVIAGYAAVFFIVKGGFLYILARGESGSITAAKQTIINAIIGLIICILAAAIVTAIGGAIQV